MSAVLDEVGIPETLKFQGVQWCELTKIGLQIKRKNFSYEEWENVQSQLTIADKGCQFGLGDWLVAGEARHGEKTAQAIDANNKTGVKVKTLMEYRRVSEKVPYPIRMDSLEWSHHQIVANLPTQPERVKWLVYADKNDLMPAQLRRAINDAVRPSVGGSSHLDPHYKQFLLDYIAAQHSLLNKCPYEPFKREIERTIRVANFQRARTLNSDYGSVAERVDEGACTVDELLEEVFLEAEEIKKIAILMVGCPPPTKKEDPVQAGTPYEWRPIGANTDVARGTRAHGIFRKDAPSGNDFHVSGYHPTIEYEDDKEESF